MSNPASHEAVHVLNSREHYLQHNAGGYFRRVRLIRAAEDLYPWLEALKHLHISKSSLL